MNLVELERKLMAAARSNPPSDEVPYAFTQRMLARLPARPVFDAWASWAQGLWRAAASCVAIMLLLSAWTVVTSHSSGPSETLAADFERTVWGPLTSINDSW